MGLGSLLNCVHIIPPSFHKWWQANRTFRKRPFYRKYPYSGQVPFARVDLRGAIDFRLGYFFNRIPKAANTTLTMALAELSTGIPVQSKQAKKLFKNPSDLSNNEVIDFERLFKFIFVRNPYTRTLSAYLDKIVRGKGVPETLTNGCESTFLEFCQFLRDGGLYSNIHWAPQTSIMLLPLRDFDFVGKIERIDDDFDLVLDRLGSAKSVSNFLGLEKGRRKSANSNMRLHYNDAAAEIVRSLFWEDFQRLGYSDKAVVDI